MPFRFAAATAAVIPSQDLGVVLYRVLLLPCIMSACVMGHGFPSKTRWMDGRTDGWACRSLHGGNPLFFRHGLKLCETVCQTRRFFGSFVNTIGPFGGFASARPRLLSYCGNIDTLFGYAGGWKDFFFEAPSRSSVDCANELQFNCYVCHQDQDGIFERTVTTRGRTLFRGFIRFPSGGVFPTHRGRN